MDTALDQIPETALRWHEAGAGAVLATVVATWGSAPRPVGSQMAISGAGEMAGSVSGGCVEGAVVGHALSALETRRPELLSFGVADETAFGLGLACGGRIEVLVEPVGGTVPALAPALLRDLVAARAARRPVAVITDLRDWQRALIAPQAGAQSGRDAQGAVVTLHAPPLRLIVVGAVHIAQALVPMARIAGFTPIIIEPRTAFGTEARFPGEDVRDDWPDAALAGLGLDARTAVVTLTHDAKLDDPALMAALTSEVFYIGALGSRRTHAQRLERLRAAGLTEASLARIHAPVGLAIGARSPAEIALAVLAEITQVLRKGA